MKSMSFLQRKRRAKVGFKEKATKRRKIHWKHKQVCEEIRKDITDQDEKEQRVVLGR